MPAPATAEPGQNTTDQVFGSLYSAILTLDLLPGSKVSETEVAKSLGVSRQPVRDAFYRLSELGFLRIRPQRATMITCISEAALRDARFIREALEVECLHTAIENRTEADIAGLEDLLTAQKTALSAGDRLTFHTLDDQFHKAIAEIAGHPGAWAVIRDQKVHLDRVRYLSLSIGAQCAFDDHRDILNSLISRDGARAEARLRQHLSTILQVLAQARCEHSAYFED